MESSPVFIGHGNGSSLRASSSKDSGSETSRAWLLLLIFSVVLQVLCLWNGSLSGVDSPRVAGIAREMAVTSNYLIPRLNGENFLEYPSLGYWPMAIALTASENPSDFLPFLPIVLLGTGTVLITFLIGKKLAGEKIGLSAGFILATMTGFVSYHRHCRVDPALLFFITLSLYGLIRSDGVTRRGFLSLGVFHLAVACAFLSKGIIGIVIPIATAVLFLFTRRDLAAVRRLFLTREIFFFFMPILLWIVGVWWLEGPGIFEEVIRQSLWRFLSSSTDHAKSYHFYLVPAFGRLLPWVFLPLVLLGTRWKPHVGRQPVPCSLLLRLGLVWFLTVFIGLSLASAKRSIYLGPIFPPFAFLAALGWDRLRETFPLGKRWEKPALVLILSIYVGTHLLFVLPAERKAGFRPVFETVLSQEATGPAYLCNPSETLRGAAFFYLGKRTPVVSGQDVLSGNFEDRRGTTLVVESHGNDSRLLSTLESRDYRLLFRKKQEKGGIFVFMKNS